MRVQTQSRLAFESVNSALRSIESYYDSRNIRELEAAKEKLEIATAEDPGYLDAKFYSGITNDLIGKPVLAVPLFQDILKEVSNKQIKNEARYNLAVAFYHQYSHRFLEQAKKYFDELLSSTLNVTLRKLAHAGLAQTYAMWMIPNSAERSELSDPQTREATLKKISGRYAASNKFEQKTKGFTLFLVKASDKKKIEATTKNAKGMALMYYSDWLSKDEQDKKAKLDDALAYLEASDEIMANDWANTCDLGSVHWRMSLLSILPVQERGNELATALGFFNKVITDLRPGYGFAYYELGRIYRTHSQFDKAIENFDKSLAVQSDYRDVSDDTVNTEKHRAEANDSAFP